MFYIGAHYRVSQPIGSNESEETQRRHPRGTTDMGCYAKEDPQNRCMR